MTKKDFTPRQERLARFAKALAHPVRLAILQMLASSECCYHGDMSDVLPVAKSTLSQHLRELKDAGLIQGEITPPTVKYCIDPAGWEEAKHLFSSFFAHLPTKETDSGKQEEVGKGME